MKGCPVSVSEQVLALVNSLERKPIFDKSYMKMFNAGYAGAKFASMKRAFTKPYQKADPQSVKAMPILPKTDGPYTGHRSPRRAPVHPALASGERVTPPLTSLTHPVHTPPSPNLGVLETSLPPRLISHVLIPRRALVLANNPPCSTLRSFNAPAFLFPFESPHMTGRRKPSTIGPTRSKIWRPERRASAHTNSIFLPGDGSPSIPFSGFRKTFHRTRTRGHGIDWFSEFSEWTDP